jgi:hypothetical protein
MALPGALLALFLAGSWLYCLTDAALTPAPECRGLPKPAWLAVIAVTLSAGALAWLIVRHRTYRRSAPRRTAGGRGDGYLGSLRWTDADDAVARHPAGRARAAGPRTPRGPDDDPEFIRALGRAIRRNPPVG